MIVFISVIITCKERIINNKYRKIAQVKTAKSPVYRAMALSHWEGNAEHWLS